MWPQIEKCIANKHTVYVVVALATASKHAQNVNKYPVLILMNDLHYGTDSCIKLFADDTKIQTSHKC